MLGLLTTICSFGNEGASMELIFMVADVIFYLWNRLVFGKGQSPTTIVIILQQSQIMYIILVVNFTKLINILFCYFLN